MSLPPIHEYVIQAEHTELANEVAGEILRLVTFGSTHVSQSLYLRLPFGLRDKLVAFLDQDAFPFFQAVLFGLIRKSELECVSALDTGRGPTVFQKDDDRARRSATQSKIQDCVSRARYYTALAEQLLTTLS